MSSQRYKAGQLVNLLQLIDVEIANRKKTPQACRESQIVMHMCVRWQKEFGGMKLDQVMWLVA